MTSCCGVPVGKKPTAHSHPYRTGRVILSRQGTGNQEGVGARARLCSSFPRGVPKSHHQFAFGRRKPAALRGALIDRVKRVLPAQGVVSPRHRKKFHEGWSKVASRSSTQPKTLLAKSPEPWAPGPVGGSGRVTKPLWSTPVRGTGS